MAKFLTLDDVEVKNKVVLVRVDFNSPVDPETKKIIGDSRIRAHGESTIKELSEKGAKVVVLAHQGRKGDSDFIPLKQHAVIGVPDGQTVARCYGIGEGGYQRKITIYFSGRNHVQNTED